MSAGVTAVVGSSRPADEAGFRRSGLVRLLGLLRTRFGRWRAIAALLPKAGWPIVACGLLENLVLGLLPLAFVTGTSVMVQRVIDGAGGRAGPGRAGAGQFGSGAGVGAGAVDWGPVLAAFGFAMAALVLQNALSPVQAVLGEFVSRRVDGHCVRRLLAVGLSDAPISLLERQDVLDKLSDARAGLVEYFTTPGAAASGLLALVSRYAQLTGAVVLVGVVLSPTAGAVLALTACAARIGNRGSLVRWSTTIRTLSGQRRRNRYVLATGSDPAIAKDMRVLGIVPWFRDRADQESRALLSPLWRERRRIYFAPFLVLTAVVLVGAATVVLQLRGAASRGELSVLDLSLAIQAILIPMRFGVFFPESDVQTQYGMQAHDTIVELEHLVVVGARETATGTRSAAGMPATGIRFDGVHFAYPGTDRPVLAGLDLELAAGSSTAIVGLNGAGKTTLVKLLARLYEPTAGRIVVDGVDVRELDLRGWQRRLAVIFQDYVRYELDAAANIGLGAPARLPDRGALRAAAKWADAAEVIDSLPAGFDTPLSSRYAGGVDLSGGQWQRVALARALLAVQSGASVLVLDEPTAQLDVRAEVAFFDRFIELTQGLTSVVISHRFSTVRRADRIVVIEHGRVVEAGDHDSLLLAGGRYATLFDLQARRFADGDPEADGPEAADPEADGPEEGE